MRWVVGIEALLLVFCVQAQDLKASVAYIPTLAESPTEGAFVELVQAMDEVYSGGEFDIEVFPFGRSILNVSSGKADFHLPMLRSPYVDISDKPFRYVSKPMGTVCLVLYSNRESFLSRELVLGARQQKNYPYRLAMMRGSAQFVDIPVKEVSRIRDALYQVALGRIDAFIGAQEEADHVLREEGLQDVHRSYFECFDDVILVARGARGDEIERILIDALSVLEGSGRLWEIRQRIHVPYQEWQIYDTD